jgi:putative CRISPR-associated protein (TIGR02620 family)
MKVVVASRHPGAIDWLREQGRVAAALEVSPEEWEAAVTEAKASVTEGDVKDAIVVGNVPLHLAAMAKGVLAIEFAGAPPRGAEYAADEMAAAGARLTYYEVSRGRVRPIPDGCLPPAVGDRNGAWVCTETVRACDCLPGEARWELM